jgi:FkbM family methyltransferase
LAASDFHAKRLLRGIIASSGVYVGSARRFQRAMKRSAEFGRLENALRLLQGLPGEELARIVPTLLESPSQLAQDVWVLATLGSSRPGYFVEFGAADGKMLSNTFLLERRFGWSGIVAEPGRFWHPDLAANRSCRIDHDCVWSRSGLELRFNETAEAEYSTVESHSSSGSHSGRRRFGKPYSVRTVSLMDLLARHGAPDVIDYLSVDTEGSEHEILAAVDFSRVRFRTISCEHNHGEDRARIHSLLSSHGYARVHEDLSLVDDWYVGPPA